MRWPTIIIAIFLSGCASWEMPGKKPDVIARNNAFAIVLTGQNDTLQSLAEYYYGDASKYWVIGEFNKINSVSSGQEIVIPLKPVNPVGVFRTGYVTVPILAYHQFGPGNTSRHKLEVSKEMFRNQMAYLRDNDYHVIRLTDLTAFLEGKTPLPRKSVI